VPIYEYRCENGHLFEVMQRMTEDPVTECEVCGAPVQRVLHPVAVHFKGKGFYNTDYGTKKRQRELKAAGEGSSSSDSSSGDSSSGDSSSSDSSSGGDSAKKDSGSSSSGGDSGSSPSKSDSPSSSPKKSDSSGS
jgi:putative FmdB family regulatory protein